MVTSNGEAVLVHALSGTVTLMQGSSTLTDPNATADVTFTPGANEISFGPARQRWMVSGAAIQRGATLATVDLDAPLVVYPGEPLTLSIAVSVE